MSELIHAGAIPFRRSAGRWEFLLVTSKRGNWIFPKGIVELGDSTEETAERECAEEAGVHGTVVPGLVGIYDDQKWQRPCRVYMFLLRYDSEVEWEESDIRRRGWFAYDDALDRLRKPELRSILEFAQRRVETLEE